MRLYLSTYLAALRRRVVADERGDVPGWVLVTLVNGAWVHPVAAAG